MEPTVQQKNTRTVERSRTTREDGSEAFDELVREILADPAGTKDKFDALTDDEIIKLQHKLNPYGSVPATSSKDEESIAFSWVNIRDSYAMKRAMTGIIGYTFQMQKEWEPEAELRRWKPQNAEKKYIAESYSAENLRVLAEEFSKATNLAVEAEKRAVVAGEEALIADIEDSTDAVPKIVASQNAMKAAVLARYVATHRLYKMGLDAHERLDQQLEDVHVYTDLRANVLPDPTRLPSNELEVPVDVAKTIVDKFLRTWFEYNPNNHFKPAPDGDIYDSSVATDVATGMVEGNPRRMTLKALRDEAPAPTAEQKSDVETLTRTEQTRNAAALILGSPDLSGALKRILVAGGESEYLRLLSPIPTNSEARTAIDVVPPHDTFARLAYYMSVNFEELRIAVRTLYNEVPDLDVAILPCKHFAASTRAEINAEFDEFKLKYHDDMVAGVVLADYGSWTLLEDFKQNRDVVDFYNKNTKILKRIMDRVADDRKTGNELMKKRVTAVKAKNIREEGPDAVGLGEYSRDNNKLAESGVSRTIGAEEMKRLEAARGNLQAAHELELMDQLKKTITNFEAAGKIRPLSTDEKAELKNARKDLELAIEMLAVPDDGVQINMYTHDTLTGKVKKDVMYTASDAAIEEKEGIAPPIPAGSPGYQELLRQQAAVEASASPSGN
jgi:hypothetical protein